VSGPTLIDLLHLGRERVVAAFLIETPDGPGLFDCGPATTIDTLRGGLAAHGLAVSDLRHLLLSHIHFDHAGAAGLLVRENPGLQVHVSPIGAPHLADPERLEQSARRVYGAAFDRLWGSLVPIPEPNLRPAGDRVLDFECFPSPGHASHHVCYLRDGVLYGGDAVGVRIAPSQRVLSPTPPPDVDVDGWLATLDEVDRRDPERLVLVHFGVFDDARRHLAEFRERLVGDAEFVAAGATEDEYVERVRGVIAADAHLFEHAVPARQCYQGLARYWQKKRSA
jgi:glyoxylase-like metal-dependent hydrolase (beta-lactamase superfamily II)